MRYWRDGEKMPVEQCITPDGLHMNAWAYGCIAKLLAVSLLDGTKLPSAMATTSTGIK